MPFIRQSESGAATNVVKNEMTEDYLATNGATAGKAYVDDPLNPGQVVQADNTNPAHKNKFKGIAENTVGVGEMVRLRHGGELHSVGYSFSNLNGPIFYDANGDVVETAPVAGDHIQILGTILKSDRVEVDADPATAI